jgi:hypothetical protein
MLLDSFVYIELLKVMKVKFYKISSKSNTSIRVCKAYAVYGKSTNLQTI